VRPLEWAQPFRRRCPAVAWISPDNYPRCDLRYGHEGAHVADRGMDQPTWTERWQA
jgi:hypothetical protein